MEHRGLRIAVQAAVAVVLIALIAGQLLGQPVLLGFVETGSMEPTIEAGDGFVAIPSALAGDPEPGDVVVFDAQEIEGGELTTHRIVEETDAGYVTQGDANPVTDQDGAEPLVQDAQIVAVAWEVGGEPVTIPYLGTAVMGVGSALESVQFWLATSLGLTVLLEPAGLAYALLAISLLLFVVETVRERREPNRESRVGGGRTSGADEEWIDPRLLAAGFALLLVVAASAAMLVPAGTHSYDVVSAEFDSERPTVIEAGTTDDLTYAIPNGGLVPTVSYVESGNDAVATPDEPVTVGPRDEAAATVSITAPEETGHYPTYVTEYRYLHVLPLPVIDALYELHPWAPFLAIVSLLGGTAYALGRLVLGRGDARSRLRATRNRRSTHHRRRH